MNYYLITFYLLVALCIGAFVGVICMAILSANQVNDEEK